MIIVTGELLDYPQITDSLAEPGNEGENAPQGPRSFRYHFSSAPLNIHLDSTLFVYLRERVDCRHADTCLKEILQQGIFSQFPCVFLVQVSRIAYNGLLIMGLFPMMVLAGPQ
jgi:hypothetical protein